MALLVGLIGLGEVAQLMHLPLLADDPRFRIAAVADVSHSLADYIGARYGVQKVGVDAQAVISDPDIDAVFILTPDHMHAELLSRAISAGKHVFIEKPACLTASQLVPILEQNASNPNIVFVGYMRRYARAFLELQKVLPPISDIRHVRIRDLIRESRFFVDQTRHIFRPKDVSINLIAEGRQRTQSMLRSVVGTSASNDVVRAYQVLTGLSSHSFSAMRELLGAPKGITAAHQNRGENLAVLFDYGHFICVYEAVINNVARFDSGIEVLTNHQQFKINYDTPYVRNLPTRLEITTSSDTETSTVISGPYYEDPFRIELDAFYNAVTSGQRPKTSLEDSMVDLNLFAEIGHKFK